MLPTLFTIGTISISSFGFFLSLGFLFALHLIWRLARAWDLPEEKILDLFFLTIFGGLLGARILFIILNFEFFDSLSKMILITKYPGLSFWGGLFGGWLTLYFLTKRTKLNFWQIADIAAVGVIGGIILGDIGCFLGGCGFSNASNFFLSVPVVGLIGKRLPLQVFEAGIFLFFLSKLWYMATHFHYHGKIISFSLIFIGLIKLIFNLWKGQGQEALFAIITFGLGLVIFYRVSKRHFWEDLKKLPRKETAIWILKYLSDFWYNQKIAWKLLFQKLRLLRTKKFPSFLRRKNVRL